MITKNRIYGLDLMRAVAMLCVILSHSGYRLIFGMRYGIIAVESFFVVSGFLIGGILIRDFKDEVNVTNVTNFWKKRWFRTLPLYYAVLLLKFALIDHTIGFNLLYYFTFLQSNFYGIDYLPVSWTLVVEEWFYLLMPLFFIIFFRKGIQPKRFYVLIAVFVVLANVLRFIYVTYTHAGYGAVVGNFVMRMDSNLIGVGLAGLRLFHKDIFQKMALPKFAIIFAMLILLLAIAFGYHHGGGTLKGENHLWINTIWFSLISFTIALIIPFFYCAPIYAAKEGKQPFRWFITWISLLSYPIYLIHVEMYKVMDKAFPILANEWKGIPSFIIENSVVVLIGLLLYHFIDKPVLNFRSKFLK